MPRESSPSTDHSSQPGRSTQRLAVLGAESDTERAVKRIAPWAVSVALHAGLVALGFVLTWTVVTLTEDHQPTLIVAEFNALAYQPLASLNDDLETPDELLTPDRAPIEPLEKLLSAQLAELQVDPLSMISDAVGPSLLIEFAPDPTQNAATFVGLRSTNARRIVYVIDASGSMIRSLQIVIQELARSLARLTPQQRFGLVFFQRNEALMVPPTTRLLSATPDAKVAALRWIDENVIPAGRSNPLAAIEKALSFKPDVIFLLSENITGSGEFEIDREDLLALLDQLNPKDPETGRRGTQISCVQFLYPDPLETLLRIAQEHGGPNGYKFLDAAELGLTAP